MSEYLKADRTQLMSMPFAGYVTFQAINQPPILVPGEPDQIKRSIASLKKPPNAYYGIGGDTENFRSLVTLLALSRYKNEVQRWAGTCPGVVLYDAYPYDFLNQINGYEQLGDIWKAFRNRLEENSNDVEVKISKRRNVYQKMGNLLGTKIRYIDASWLLRKPEYEEALFGLLDNPSWSSWELLVPVRYRNNKASLLYVPMEIAEALTLKKLYGTRLKVGDKREKGFDKLISREEREWLFAYTPSTITPTGERPPYRADDVNFDMSEEEIVIFLKQSPGDVKRQFTWLLQELGKSSGNLIDDVLSVFSEIKGGNND